MWVTQNFFIEFAINIADMIPLFFLNSEFQYIHFFFTYFHKKLCYLAKGQWNKKNFETKVSCFHMRNVNLQKKLQVLFKRLKMT